MDCYIYLFKHELFFIAENSLITFNVFNLVFLKDYFFWIKKSDDNN